jgi:hypothetical protein
MQSFPLPGMFNPFLTPNMMHQTNPSQQMNTQNWMPQFGMQLPTGMQFPGMQFSGMQMHPGIHGMQMPPRLPMPPIEPMLPQQIGMQMNQFQNHNNSGINPNQPFFIAPNFNNLTRSNS